MAKVLLVEDDNNLREIYEARLQAEGYAIVSAKDGEEALVLAKSEKPDLIISDVMMPRVSGFEMLDILRNTEGLKDTKIIMLTALGQAEDKTRADSLGADKYLVKSQVTLEDIVKTAQDLLAGAAGASPAPAAAPTPATPAAPTPAAPTSAPSPAPATVPTPVAVKPAPPVTPAPAIPVTAPSVQPTAAPTSPPAPTPVPAPPAPAAPAAPLQPPEPKPTPAPPTVPVPQPGIPTPTEPPKPPAPATNSTPPAPARTPPPALSPVPTPAPQPTPPPVPPKPMPKPEPAPAPPQPAVSDTLTQSTSNEEAAIRAQIEEFVNKPAPAAGAQPPKAAPETPPIPPTPTPAAITPAPPAAPTLVTPTTLPTPVANTEATDKLVADAVKNLSEGTVKPEQPAPMPPPPAPAAKPESQDDAVTVAHKKIIKPIAPEPGTPTRPDLNELLAREGIADINELPHQPAIPSNPAPQTYTTPHPPGHVISPGGVDPNSIAL